MYSVNSEFHLYNVISDDGRKYEAVRAFELTGSPAYQSTASGAGHGIALEDCPAYQSTSASGEGQSEECPDYI